MQFQVNEDSVHVILSGIALNLVEMPCVKHLRTALKTNQMKFMIKFEKVLSQVITNRIRNQ